MRILLVEDETELALPLSRVLSHEGYSVDIASDGETAIEKLRSSPNNPATQASTSPSTYDLLILDWILPRLSGLEICQWVRSQRQATPILMLTAKDTLDERVQGLDAGADDYLVKPFELRELLARVRALLRRSTAIDEPTESHKMLKVDDLELDSQNQLAYRRGRAINLSEKETQLLEYLMTRSQQLLNHEEIYQHLWPGEDKPSSNVLAAQVRLLRRKIEAAGEAPLIHTVYGKGYRFGL